MSLEFSLAKDLILIKKYIDESLSPSQITTTHMYENKLPSDIKNSVIQVKNSNNIYSHLLKLTSLKNKIKPVTEMNEVYCSKHRGVGCKAGSDAVFETKHIDGPFGMIPKMTLFRCIVTICNETETETIVKENTYNMKEGEFVAIDYNRDLHYIKVKDDFTPGEKAKRYVLKLHYISYPSWCPEIIAKMYGLLNINYNIIARKAFLYTLKPTTFPQKTLNWAINTTTKIWAVFFYKSGPDVSGA